MSLRALEKRVSKLEGDHAEGVLPRLPVVTLVGRTDSELDSKIAKQRRADGGEDRLIIARLLVNPKEAPPCPT